MQPLVHRRLVWGRRSGDPGNAFAEWARKCMCRRAAAHGDCQEARPGIHGGASRSRNRRRLCVSPCEVVQEGTAAPVTARAPGISASLGKTGNDTDGSCLELRSASSSGNCRELRSVAESRDHEVCLAAGVRSEDAEYIDAGAAASQSYYSAAVVSLARPQGLQNVKNGESAAIPMVGEQPDPVMTCRKDRAERLDNMKIDLAMAQRVEDLKERLHRVQSGFDPCTPAGSADATGSQPLLAAAVSSASPLSIMTVQTDEPASMTTVEEQTRKPDMSASSNGVAASQSSTQQPCMCPGHVGRGGRRRHLDPGKPGSVNAAFGMAFDSAREWERSAGRRGAQMRITEWRRLCTELRQRIPECAVQGSLQDRRHRESGWSPVASAREDRERPESFWSWLQRQATEMKAQTSASAGSNIWTSVNRGDCRWGQHDTWLSWSM